VRGQGTVKEIHTPTQADLDGFEIAPYYDTDKFLVHEECGWEISVYSLPDQNLAEYVKAAKAHVCKLK
jgi:hypothetical protein